MFFKDLGRKGTIVFFGLIALLLPLLMIAVRPEIGPVFQVVYSVYCTAVGAICGYFFKTNIDEHKVSPGAVNNG